MRLAVIGFVLMLVLMFVLIKEKMSPPVTFIILPLIAALAAGCSMTEIAGFIEDGMLTMLDTAVLFIFSISYFTLMSDAGLFDPIINFLIKKTGKGLTTIFMAIVLTTFVAHLDGSGATTFLIVIPAFLPICKRVGIRPQALMGGMCGAYATMNIVPWGGPTIRAASVAGIEASDLYAFIGPGVVAIALMAFVIAFVVSLIEKKNGAGVVVTAENAEATKTQETEEKSTRKWVYWFNLVMTLVMLVVLFIEQPLPLYSVFMIAFSITLVVNYPNVKEQSKKIKHYGSNAMVMCMTLFSVGIFMGVISGSGMVDAMATAIVNALPSALAPHMHWIMAIFAVPLMMILGTDAFYYALLPIIIGVVAPFGVTSEIVAATFLLTATFGTPVSPSVAAVYVGLGLTDITIGDHIKYTLRLVWPASIIILIVSTLLGVIQF